MNLVPLGRGTQRCHLSQWDSQAWRWSGYRTRHLFFEIKPVLYIGRLVLVIVRVDPMETLIVFSLA